MDIFDSTIYILYSIQPFFVFFIGFLFILYFSKKIGINLFRAIFLYYWHSVFCIIYIFYAISYGADSIFYFNASKLNNLNFSYGTSAITLFTSIFSKYLNFTIYSVFFIYNIIGSAGLILFYKSLYSLECNVNNKNIIYLSTFLVILPSVSYWSSAIGKDAISFFAISLIIWAYVEFKQRIIFFWVGTLLIFVVRPHIGILIILSIFLEMVISRKMSIFLRLCLLFLLVFLLFTLIYVLVLIGFGGLSNFNEIGDYLEYREGLNSEGGSSVDISSMSLPEKLFAYLFRPTILEAKNFTSLMSSLENFILLIFFIKWLFSLRHVNIRKKLSNIVFIWSYALSAWILLALTTANLGIAVRQKWMFLPMIFFLFMYSNDYKNQIHPSNEFKN